MIVSSRKLVPFTVIYAVRLGKPRPGRVIGIGTGGTHCGAHFRDGAL